MTKKYILSLLFLIIASVVFAQQQISVKIWKGGKADIIEQIDSITFPNTTQHITCIDLGLSVKWGSCNIGAETPEAYGNYYAWGEVIFENVMNFLSNPIETKKETYEAPISVDNNRVWVILAIILSAISSAGITYWLTKEKGK